MVLLQELHCGDVRFAVQQPGPELDRPIHVDLVFAVGSEITERSVRQRRRSVGLCRKKSDQGTVPVDFVPADAHRWIVKAIAKQTTLMSRVNRLTNFLPVGVGTVEEPAEIVRPNLSVARHRLAIEADVVGQCAEEHMGQLVFLGDQSSSSSCRRTLAQRWVRLNVLRTGPCRPSGTACPGRGSCIQPDCGTRKSRQASCRATI